MLESYETLAKLQVVSRTENGQAHHQVSWQVKPQSPVTLEASSGSLDLSRLVSESGSDHQEKVIARFGKQKVVLQASMIRQFIQLRMNVQYD